jgi:DNA-directed RNA polymerase specialized sigma24 family protein
VAPESGWQANAGLITKIVNDRLSQCPIEHRGEIIDEIHSAYDEAEWHKTIQNPRAYALGITRHKIARHLRDHYRYSPIPDDERGLISTATDEIGATEMKIDVENELRSLAKTHPAAVQAFRARVEGYKLREIAIWLGVSIAAVDRWIRLIQEILSAVLK